jgi:hypothetical protein
VKDVRNLYTIFIELALDSIGADEVDEFLLLGGAVLRSFSMAARAVARRIRVDRYLVHDCVAFCLTCGFFFAQLLVFCGARNEMYLRERVSNSV